MEYNEFGQYLNYLIMNMFQLVNLLELGKM